MKDMAENPRRPSYTLQPEDALDIVRRLHAGELQSRIAADYDVNGGRISEINTGHRFSEITGIRPKKQFDLFDE